MPHSHENRHLTTVQSRLQDGANLHLTGPHGTGKTHALQTAIHQLDHPAIYLSCRKHTTTTQVYRQILTHLTDTPPTNGIKTSTLHQHIATAVDHPLHIILDDITYLQHHDDLTALKQLHSIDHIHTATATSNPTYLTDNRDHTIWNAHNPTTVNIPEPDIPTTEHILTTILGDLDHLTDDTIHTIARTTGNLQYALIYADTIIHHTDDHPDTAAIHSLKDHAATTYRDHVTKPFTPHHRILLHSILDADDNKPATSTVTDTYTDRCNTHGIDPVTSRRIHTYLTDLELAGLITTHTESHGRHGRKRLIDVIDLTREA